MTSLPTHLLVQISAHHGLIHRNTLFAAGFGDGRHRALVSRRILERLNTYVFRLRGSPDTPAQRMLIGCWSHDGVITHRTAAAVHGLPGFGIPDLPEVMIQESTYRPTGLARLRTVNRLRPQDRTRVDRIPITTVPRTLLALAGIASTSRTRGETSRWRVEDAFDHALANQQTTESAITEMLEQNRGSGRSGVALLDELLEARKGGQITESHLERRTLEVIGQAGLPLPVCQSHIAPNAEFVARVDFMYPDLSVVIEVSGHRWHRSPKQFDRDTERRRQLTTLGLQVYEFTYRQITRQPGLLIDLVRSLHDRRGMRTADGGHVA